MTGDLRAAGGPPSFRGRRLRVPGEPWLVLIALAMASGLALGLADYAGVQGRGGLGDALRATGAMVLLFGVAGIGPTRLWLPDRLKAYELLWVLPVGGCVLALALAVPAYAHVPMDVSLPVVGGLGVVLGVFAYQRDPVSPVSVRHGRASWRAQLIPLYLALLIGAIALVPMFRGGFATVIGNGSDAHLAVGTGEFLQSHYPGDEAIEEPVDIVPHVWESKPPIYLAYGAVAKTAGLPPYQVIASLAAALMAMAALGFWLMARHMLSASLWGAAVAMSLVGLDRMVLYTGMHPYFNQTWGFFAMPFAIVLAWLAVRERTRGTVVLAGLFLAIVAFSYPLALPFPLLPALTFLVIDRRAKGLPAVPRPRLPRNRKALWWLIPVGLLMLRALIGVAEKIETALRVVAPWESLANWGGDQLNFIPERLFFGISDAGVFLLFIPIFAFGIHLALRRAPREVRIGLGAVIVGALLAALFFRPRDAGQYFHFKILAFGAPIAVATAAAGLSQFRYRWLGPIALVALLGIFRNGAANELGITFDQLPKSMIALQELDERLPPDKSIRLDLQIDGRQLWIASMLHGQPLCSQKPVLETSYPHVPISRQADYVLVDRGLLRPFDADGPPVDGAGGYRLYRLKRGLGPDRCSQRMVQPIVVVR